MVITVVTIRRYIGVFIVDRDADTTWLDEKVQGWAELVSTLSGVAPKHPQSYYAGLNNSLQQEWVFVQQVTPDILDASVPVEKAL